ncbi:MAG: polysulfide reductase NrfD [Hydrogenophilus sp.]|nr:polysulfide reductase NrfD [Hydrogenophilus sp.]
MAEVQFWRLDLERYDAVFYRLLVTAAILLVGGGIAFFALEHEGHAITGMSEHVVWGFPHVMAIYLIVAASGVLNVASIASVFGKKEYKPYAPLSAWLSLALLVGGLSVLVLDLGQPGRLTVAMTHFNFRSMFAWNVFLYTGLMVLIVGYLWTMYDRRATAYSTAMGSAVFLWRLVLTSGTGLIFGFLVGRDGYGSALMAPMFLALSFAWGWAIFLLVQEGIARWAGEGQVALSGELLSRARRLLAIFVAAALYFVVVHLLTYAYFDRHEEFVHFIVAEGGIYSILFWIGFVGVGSVFPLILTLFQGGDARLRTQWAAWAVTIGAFSFLYLFIIGGQAYPLQPFAGYEVVASGFDDGQVASYSPRWPEILLALGGGGVALLIVSVGVRVWPLTPVLREKIGR